MRENVGTGFDIGHIGNFDFIFTPDKDFKQLSEKDKEQISQQIDSMKKRFFKYFE